MSTALIHYDPLTASSTPTAPSPPPDRSTEFTAVDPNVEQFSGPTLVVEAYAAIWLILMGWIFFQWRRQATLAERLDDLERTIDRAAANAEKAKAGAR
jgi:CcmD family protein